MLRLTSNVWFTVSENSIFNYDEGVSFTTPFREQTQHLISEPRPWSAAVTTGPMETRTFTDDEGYTIPWHLMAFAWMPGTLATASTFASDPDRYMATLRAAWTKLMTADRFDGPTGNVCDAQLDDMTCTPANVGAACGSPTAGKSCTCHGHHARNLLFASTPMRDHCRCA